MLARSRALLGAALLATFVPSAQAGGAEPPRRATPAWVDEVPIDLAGNRDAGADYGVAQLLSDQQVHLGRSSLERYARRAFRVESAAGVASSSELHFGFDPTFEHFALHYVRILRDGAVLDALRNADWQVIQPESDRDRRVYNGELEGLVFLHDVRAGDVVDYSFSIEGASRVAGGRFADRMALAEGAPVARLRRRIVADGGRQLLVRRHDVEEPVESSAAGEHAYLWERRDVPPAAGEDALPSWYVPGPWVDVSEFPSWNEVAATMAPLFPTDAAPSPQMADIVSKWRGQFATEVDRASAAIAFVQDEVRYLGIEMGPHSHEPFPPATVLARRFGDCKDKALLLVVLLRALGLQADVALVNTNARRMLDERLPSPFAFDHAIVRAVVGGAVRWIDATESYQRGTLSERPPPPFERALVVAARTTGLESIDPQRPRAPTYEVDETYTVSSTPDARVGLDVVTTYRGRDADGMREELANTSIAELARGYLNYYAKKYPKITPSGDPSFADDPDADSLVVRESYSIGDFFVDGDRAFWPEAIERHLRTPRIVRRTMPLAVDEPCLVAQHTHLKLPARPSFDIATTDLADEALRFHASHRVDGNTFTLDYGLEALADFVPADRVAQHLATLEKIRDAARFHLDAADARRAPSPPRDDSWAWHLSFGILGFAGVLGVVGVALGRRERRRREAFRKRAAMALGESPTNPILVRGEGEIAARLAATRCACRGAFAAPARAAADDVRLGERVVRIVRATCTKCGTDRRVYFHVGRDTAEPSAQTSRG